MKRLVLLLAMCAPAALAQSLAITTTTFTPGVVGIAYSLQLAGSGGTLPYKWTVTPAIIAFPVPGQVLPGLMLDSTAGLVSGSPTAAGTYAFTITLTDAAQGTVSKMYSITVTPGGPLGITTATLPNGTVGAPYSQTIQAIGGIPPYKWSVSTGSLPSGLTFDPVAGTISGAPLLAGTTNFTVTITDNAATPNTAKQALALQVLAPAPLAITTSTLPGGTQSAPYSQTVAATGGVPPYTWTVASGSLPAGLTLSASTGKISGTPTTPGSSGFSIQVTDSSAATKAKATQAYTVVIAQLTPVSVTAATLVAGTVAKPYSTTLTATGGAAPYSWSVIAGSLPPGLLLSASGTISGVPTVATTFAFTAKVVDVTGGTSFAAFSLSVAPAPLTMVPPALPSGVATSVYPAQVLSATGGAPPYTFSIQGALPAGITLTNGQIAGTPTTTGTSSFTVVVTDSAKATATAPGQILVRASLPPDLVLSTSALNFSLATGASDVPEPQTFTVASSNSSSVLSYQITASPAAPWLTVSGGLGGTANTPGGISVGLNAQALALTASTTPYSTTLSVTCLTTSPCTGSVQKVVVSLTVSSPAPLLTLTKSVLALSVASTNGQATGQFGIQNAGGGSITVNSVTSPDSWLTIGNAPASVAPGPPSYVSVTANATGLNAGLYQSTITVATSAGSANLPVTLLVSTTITISLNPAGQQYQMIAGGAPGNPAGSFEILSGGASTLNWSAAILPGATWLKIKTTTGTSTATAPGILSYSIDPTASAALAAGSYYGTIRITSSQVANSPQDFLVVLNVAAAGASADPDPEPGGLLFISTGTGTAPSQTLTLYASSTTAIQYQASAVTSNGASWLAVTPTSGAVSAGSPVTATVSVNPGGLAPGVYRGVVTYQFSPSSLRSANITLIVPNIQGGNPFVRQVSAVTESPRGGGTCTSAKLVVSPNGIPSNFAPALAWPTPLSFQLTDDCGNNIPNGSVDATFTNGDPALALTADPANPGRYSGTWTPLGPTAQITITGTAAASGLASAKVQIAGKVTPNSAPSLTPGAMLNAFNQVVGGGIAPGTAVALYGANLAPAGTAASAASVPFPTSLSNVSVVIGGVLAPLYFVSPGQINAEVPFELVPGGSYQVTVSANGALTTPNTFISVPGAPGIAAFANGGIIAQHLDAASTLVSASAPAMPGEIIVFYLAGLGSATNQPATGNAAPIPPTGPLNPVTVTVNGAAAPALFVGLTPYTVGLYQIDFTVPMGTPDGNQVLTVSQAGAVSNVTILPVHQ